MIEDGKFDFHNGSRNNSSCERQHASGSCVPAPQYRFLTNSFFVIGTVEEGSSLLVARAAGWEQEVARRKYYEPPIGPSLRTNSRADLLIASEVGFCIPASSASDDSICTNNAGIVRRRTSVR